MYSICNIISDNVSIGYHSRPYIIFKFKFKLKISQCPTTIKMQKHYNCHIKTMSYAVKRHREIKCFQFSPEGSSTGHGFNPRSGYSVVVIAIASHAKVLTSPLFP